MDGFTGWLASMATIGGGLMVAVNLGSRLTGWGFVLLTLGSATWSFNAFQNQASSLLLANVVMAAVNAFGIWRWLGRRRRIEQGSAVAMERSAVAPVPSLVSAISVIDRPLALPSGEHFGTVVDLMLRCRQLDLDYAVLAFDGIGGLGEELRAVPADLLGLDINGLRARLDEEAIRALAPIDPAAWPVVPADLGNRRREQSL